MIILYYILPNYFQRNVFGTYVSRLTVIKSVSIIYNVTADLCLLVSCRYEERAERHQVCYAIRFGASDDTIFNVCLGL